MYIALDQPTPGERIVWRSGRIIVLAATLVLIIGLFVRPATSLDILWNILIPTLPLTFLIAPALWRNVCPLATFNLLPAGKVRRKSLTPRMIKITGNAGLLLLAVLVPARRFLFNEQGAVLAIVILGVAATALAFGFFFDLKAGFCNAICPVLPVEKLYGQQPFLRVRNARCAACTLCTPKGCLDLSPRRSVFQAIDAGDERHGWLKTGFGMFAAAFPGFITGYFTTSDAAIASAGSIYLHVVLWAAGSYLLTTLLVRSLNLRSVFVVPVVAAVSLGLYYWFAASSIASTLEAGNLGVTAIRTVTLTFVAVWIIRALRHSMRQRTA